MTEENLTEFLEQRVIPSRQYVHHIDYPAEMTEPGIGVWIDCSEGGTAMVLLPSIGPDVMHLEVHTFVDGERTEPSVTIPEQNGCVELTLRRSLDNV